MLANEKTTEESGSVGVAVEWIVIISICFVGLVLLAAVMILKYHQKCKSSPSKETEPDDFHEFDGSLI